LAVICRRALILVAGDEAMERYQVILAYDGTHFHGSQYQRGDRTVQGVFEAALHRLNWSGKSTLFAGRTDAGVHAAGQVVAFDLDWNHPPEDLRNALNALLPEDVAVSQVQPCRPDFHPRFGAESRYYRYHLIYRPTRDPLRERYAWRVWPRPDLERMQAAAQLFLGRHDFAAFGRPTRPGGGTVRQVFSAGWRPENAADPLDAVFFEVRANAFLYHMVRRLVFVQVAIGQSRMEIGDLDALLQSPGPDPIQGLAPPQGLSLVEVCYPPVVGEHNEIEVSAEDHAGQPDG
jgi:tRNA pseudouridine38-40 synthase